MAKETQDTERNFALAKENYIMLAIGFAIIVIGYLLMTGGGSNDPNVFNEDQLYSFRRVTLSPIVIMAGFVLEGYAIMAKPENVAKILKLVGIKSKK